MRIFQWSGYEWLHPSVKTGNDVTQCGLSYLQCHSWIIADGRIVQQVLESLLHFAGEDYLRRNDSSRLMKHGISMSKQLLE